MKIYPKNGFLSGMALTYVTAIVVIIIGLSVPSVAQVFSSPASPNLLNAFLISICLMVIHKIESYFTGEYDVCPVYLSSGQAVWAQNSRQAIFVAFVGTFLALMFAMYFVMQGAPWILLLLTVWMAQGLHELHHSAKSLAQKSYYSGTVSSLLFVGFIDLVLFPQWFEHLQLDQVVWFYFFYGLQPVVFLLFYLEHRSWLKKLASSS